jgi:hypothetical protein
MKTQKELIKATENFCKSLESYYESEEFYDIYAEHLPEIVNYEGILYTLDRYNPFNLSFDEKRDFAKWLEDNITDYSDDFHTYNRYCVSDELVIAHKSFGEQEEELPDIYLPEIIETDYNFIISNGYMYRDLSGSGVYLAITEEMIEDFKKIQP